jgi:Glycosyl hydrolases family 16
MPVSGVPTADLGALQADLDASQLLDDWYSSANDLYPCPGGSSYSAPSLDSSGDLDLTTSGQTGTCAYVQSNAQYGCGTYEARLYVPAGSNATIANWPAFYGSGENWPNGGEIDAFEAMGGTDFARYDPGLSAGHLSGPAVTSTPGWQTVDAVWGPGTLAVYTDGQLSDQWSSPYLDISSTGTSAMWWTFDNFTGQDGYNTGQPSTMKVQYFRYWGWQ